MGDVVKTEESQSQQLFASDQMVEIGPSVVVGAGRAGAAGVQGRVVVPESGIAKIPAFSTHQGRSMPTQPGWKDTVEQVDSVGDRHSHLPQCPDAHQVAGTSIG